MVKKIGKKKMMDNMKDFKIFEGTLISRFEIGKRYKYDDLPKSIQKEIWNLQIDEVLKVRLTEKTGEIEFRLVELF